MVRILVLPGSARTGSFNARLARRADELLRGAGADTTFIDHRAEPLPMYDGDLEEREGLPEGARRMKRAFREHDGLLLACPEYNSSITPLLKNTIDWVSRPEEGEPPLVAFRGKVAALVSASPGALGGLRGLVHVRSILGNIGVHVVPAQLAVGRAHEVLAEDGRMNDVNERRLAAVVEELVTTTEALRR